MPLQPPKKTTAGKYTVALSPVVESPAVRWSGGVWVATAEWTAWAETTRDGLVDELTAHPRWFSRTPTRALLEPLCLPWSGTSMSGEPTFFGEVPAVPTGAGAGSGTWKLTALVLTAEAIRPVWTLGAIKEEPEDDVISLFGGGTPGPEREIQLEEVEPAMDLTSGVVRIRDREWTARRDMAKERVREARMKAQFAARVAEKEEERFIRHFGDLDDTESRFSEYDFSDEGEGGTAAETDGED